MGKDLKGRELGEGLSQRKDGLYVARVTDSCGKRRSKYSTALSAAREWLARELKSKEAGSPLCGDCSVDAWFQYWLRYVKGGSIRQSTSALYKYLYEKDIGPVIGEKRVRDMKPVHMLEVLRRMSERGLRESTMGCVRTLLHQVFADAEENGLTDKNPVTRSVKCMNGAEPKGKRVLTVAEQRVFLEAARGTNYYNQYALVLQTGMRVGEVMGLRWKDVDFAKGILRVCRTLHYRKDAKAWEAGPPKTKKGAREIPLTSEARRLLAAQKKKTAAIKAVPMEYAGMVFLEADGEPAPIVTYNANIRRICARTGIPAFSMHTLRHTFATRCIEAGMKPKALQEILGHSKLSMTMDLYVHVTDNEKAKEMASVEEALKLG